MSATKTPRQRVALASPELAPEQLAKLRQLFPEVFSEGKIDFDKLRATLGQSVAAGPDRFSFTWAGKQEAIALLQTPSHATLVPCPEESLDFAATGNAFIEGDNLEVLKLLFKPYFGRVKLIYIDPPYNTGQDFVYPDNYADPLATYLQLTGQADAEGNLLTSNPETSGRYHSAWLSMMYPRLFLARQLLREDGVIFVSIDDHEVHHLRMLMNEVFGEENFVECFIWKRSYGGGAKEKYAVGQHEYILMYARDLESLPELWLPPDPEVEKRYYKYRDDKFEKRGPYRLQPLEAGKSMDKRENLIFPVPLPSGGEVMPKRQWLWSRDRMMQAITDDDLVFNQKNGEVTVAYKQYLLSESGEERGAKPASIIDGIYTQHGTQELTSIFGGSVLVQFPKPVNLMKHIGRIGTESVEGDLILDFFAGSCTTAQAVLELNREDGGNRKFLVVQLPEPTGRDDYKTIADIGKERIRRVIAKLKEADKGKLPGLAGAEDSLAGAACSQREDLGFKVFKLAKPHIQPWDGNGERDGESYVKKLAMYNDPLVPGWEAEGVLWEVALRQGYSLNTRFEKKKLKTGNTVYEVSDPDTGQRFRVCLDEEVRVEVSRELELTAEDLFVCRDMALDDTAAANLSLQCRLRTI